MALGHSRRVVVSAVLQTKIEEPDYSVISVWEKWITTVTGGLTAVLRLTRTSKVDYDPVTNPPCLRRVAASAALSAGRLGSYSDLVQSDPQVYYGEYDER